MSRTSILVTGGAGYIGSHVCKCLAENGYLPVTFDNLVTGHRDAVLWGPFHLGDVRDTDAVADAIAEHGIDTVMHFAASAYVGESVLEPLSYYDNNVGGMISLLEACQRTAVRRFVFSSSCATYGVPKRLPITEDASQDPVNPYGRTKLICEQILADYGRAHPISHVILRYFNACGADPAGRISERHNPETHLIPLVLMAAAGSIDHIDVYGTDYDTPDGTCIRDYIHVEDLARGHLAALEHLRAGKGDLTVNLGCGRGHSVLEIIAAVEKYTGRKVPVRHGARRPGDPPVLFADPGRARSRLGFATQASMLDRIIGDAAPTFGLPAPRPVEAELTHL